MPAAEAVGDSRHYTIDTIMPRHFLQTAAACGVSTALVQGIPDEIETIRIARSTPQWAVCPLAFRNGSFHRLLKACTGVCACSRMPRREEGTNEGESVFPGSLFFQPCC